jgi:hypothetical protein
VSQFFNGLIIGAGVTIQETAEHLRMCGLPQPDQGFLVQLAGAFSAQSQGATDLGEMGGPGFRKSVMCHNRLAQPWD